MEYKDIPIPNYMLHLYQHNDEYVILHKDSAEYKVCEIICEFYRIPSDYRVIKDIICSSMFFGSEFSGENIAKAFEDIENELYEAVGVASGAMLLAELSFRMKEIIDFLKCHDAIEEVFDELKIDKGYIEKFLKDADCDQIGFETCGKALLTSLLVSDCYISRFKRFVDVGLERLEESVQRNVQESRLSKVLFESIDLIRMQRIEYRIMNIEDVVRGVYSINDIISLFMFEAANCINTGVVVKKCNNCGMYFPVYGRSDVKYCSFTAPGFKNKTCKDVGAQITRSNKEKNDEITGDYRKLYMRLKMNVRRHPENTEIQELLDRLVSEGKEWRKNIDIGKEVVDKYKDWLVQIEKEAESYL